MKRGDLVKIHAPRVWGENSLTAQYHGKIALLVGRPADGWCSLLVDGKLVTLHHLTLRVIDEAR